MSGKCAELLAELRGELRGAASCARRTIKIDEPSMALWSEIRASHNPASACGTPASPTRRVTWCVPRTVTVPSP